MNNTDIRSLYGLKYNPFLPDLPPEALAWSPATLRTDTVSLARTTLSWHMPTITRTPIYLLLDEESQISFIEPTAFGGSLGLRPVLAKQGGKV